MIARRYAARRYVLARFLAFPVAAFLAFGLIAARAAAELPDPARLLLGCEHCAASGHEAGESTGAVPAALAPGTVSSWHYQLQNIDPGAIARSPADMAVIDYSDGDGRPFSRSEVETMRRKPDGSRRLVLAYLSIGQAETHRWYWPQRSRRWLGPEDPRWPGNYDVRFWDRSWQRIVFEYLDRILDAEFDGVYLDRLDVFEKMGHRAEMVDFVERISRRAKSMHRGFLVVPQNGDALIPDPRFRRAIDAFAREDLFYGENGDGERNGAESIRESIHRLRLLSAEGKPVFVVEYPRNAHQARIAWEEIVAQSFVGFLGNRPLDRP